LLVGVEGELLSVAMNTTVYDPVWLELGFQEKTPVEESKLAPAGRPVAETTTAPPVLTDVAVTVKLIHVPATTVWFAGIASVGGRLVKTVRGRELVVVCAGVDESVAVSVTVKD
jgi:hypothetical protein